MTAVRQVLTDAVQNKGCTHFDARQSTLEYSIRNDQVFEGAYRDSHCQLHLTRCTEQH